MSATKIGSVLCLVVAAIAVGTANGSGRATVSVHPSGAGALSPSVKRQLSIAKAATIRYRSVARAVADGYRAPLATPYEPEGHCAASPPDARLPGAKGGGMGIHYDNAEIIAKKGFDIRRPETLNYIPDGPKLRLVAIEFFKPDADQKLSTDGDRPTLFGRPFDGPMPGHYPGQPVHYDLHVWLYAANPNGMFSTWNPAVHC